VAGRIRPSSSEACRGTIFFTQSAGDQGGEHGVEPTGGLSL